MRINIIIFINNSKENNINRKWSNKIFLNLFIKIRSIYMNLDKVHI